jgi:repressor LexA
MGFLKLHHGRAGELDVNVMGARIRELRRKRGMTQEQLSSKLYISKSLLSDIELGKRRVHAELLHDIANILGVTTDYLIGGKSLNNVSGNI